jgi:hypothetical protein
VKATRETESEPFSTRVVRLVVPGLTLNRERMKHQRHAAARVAATGHHDVHQRRVAFGFTGSCNRWHRPPRPRGLCRRCQSCRLWPAGCTTRPMAECAR